MSTCSTATSARRGHKRRRRPSRDADADAEAGRLETRMRDLERDWDAYKAGRSGAPCHSRRSRPATATPGASSTVTATAAPGDLFDHPFRCSPRRLVASLQQAGSDDGAATVEQGENPTRPRDEDDASGVCSFVDAAAEHSSVTAAAPTAASSCHCRRAAVLGSGYSTSSSSCSTAATASMFFPAAGGVAGEHARAMEGGKRMTGMVGWLAAIALVAVGVIVATAVSELGVDEGCAEFLVPT